MASVAPVELNTERLLIRPLTYTQLLSYIQPGGTLENELGLNVYPRTIPDELKEALVNTILPAVAGADKNYLFATLWTIIERNNRVMVGDLCFKGSPDECGEVEIGYGTYIPFQGKGYMTEALPVVVRWALRQPGVTAVLAETEKSNLASHKTLQKNNFSIYKKEGPAIWWRLQKEAGKQFN